MSEGYPERQATRQSGTATRIFLAQALVIGTAASLCLFLTTGVTERAIGFGVFACAAAVVLLYLGRGGSHDPRELPQPHSQAASKSPLDVPSSQPPR